MNNIRILILEDVRGDAELAECVMRNDGIVFELCRADTRDSFLKALADFNPDIIIADYLLPSYDGLTALKDAHKLLPHIPVIIVSGELSEDRAADLMKHGAADLVFKDRLFSLGPIVRKCLKEAEEQTKTRKDLIESEKRYHELLDLESDAVFLIDAESGSILEANKSAATLYGYSKDELRSMSTFDLSAEPEQTGEGMEQQPYSKLLCYQIKKDGSRFPAEMKSTYMILYGRKLRLDIIHDITERLEMEKRLNEEREQFKSIIESAPFGVILIEHDGRCKYINRKLTEILGYELSDIPNEREFMNKAYPDPEYRKDALEAWVNDAKNTAAGKRNSRIYDVRRKDGRSKTIHFITVPLENGDHIVTIDDITDRLEIERRRQEIDTMYKILFDTANDAVFLMRNDTFIDCNKKALEMFGCTKEQIIGSPPYRFSPTLQPDGRDSSEKAMEKINAALSGEPQFFEWRHCRYDGTPFDAEVSLNIVILPEGPLINAAVHDITARKEADKKIAAAEERYRNIVESAVEGIFQSTREGKLLMANRAYASMLGYSSPEEFLKSVPNIKQVYVHPEKRRELVNIMNNEGVVRGFETEFYRKDRSIIWVSKNMRSVKDDDGNAVYFEGTIEDITMRKHAEALHRQSMEKLRRAMGGIIDVIVTTVESRDPYTSGHQKRVANLARSIATEMGMKPEHIDGIRMAGAIHDLGKISVPSEILSKPGALTEAEFNLIKQHPGIGYNILKDVEFDWPIARIVLQHHERLDGSGYPGRLKDGDILAEAKIIAVADVVESMASHRPYRPARGIDAAIDEITRNKGILYDSDAVQACVRLFTEKGYRLD